MPSIKNFFLARALRGIESVIANTDYNIIISITNESHEKEVKSVEALTNGMVDGLIGRWFGRGKTSSANLTVFVIWPGFPRNENWIERRQNNMKNFV